MTEYTLSCWVRRYGESEWSRVTYSIEALTTEEAIKQSQALIYAETRDVWSPQLEESLNLTRPYIPTQVKKKAQWKQNPLQRKWGRA
jgi:hypothetical protein